MDEYRLLLVDDDQLHLRALSHRLTPGPQGRHAGSQAGVLDRIRGSGFREDLRDRIRERSEEILVLATRFLAAFLGGVDVRHGSLLYRAIAC